MRAFSALGFSLVSLVFIHAIAWAAPAGHSSQGHAFDQGPRQRARLLPGMPVIDFPTTTKSLTARKFINQGIGQLHGFWTFEAERSFREAAVHDPNCAIAYWGMAMSNTIFFAGDYRRGHAFLETARKKSGCRGPVEQGLIEAAEILYRPAYQPPKNRQDADDLGTVDEARFDRVGMLRRLKALREQFADEVEVLAWYAHFNWFWNDLYYQAANLLPTPAPTDGVEHMAASVVREIDADLDRLFKLAPLHPAHHYRIHTWDGLRSETALESARLSGAGSPGIAHMWHMPGHTYISHDMTWAAAWQHNAGARVDHASMRRDRIVPYLIHNYHHNQDFLIKRLRALGNFGLAREIALNLTRQPRHPKMSVAQDSVGWRHLYSIAMQAEDYAEDDSKLLAPPPSSAPSEIKLLYRFYLARAAIHGGNARTADRQIRALEQLRHDPHADRDTQESARMMAELADILRRLRFSPRTQLIKDLEYITAQPSVVGPALGEAIFQAANRARSEQDAVLAAALRKFVVGAADYQLNHLESGSPFGEAESATAVWALTQLGELEAARQGLRKVLAESESLDPKSLAFARIQEVGPKLLGATWNQRADWREKRVVPATFGARPALSSLGPLLWSPPSAPAQTALDKIRGAKLVVFYVGANCAACSAQLHELSKLRSRFAKLGVRLIAVAPAKAGAEGPAPTTLSDLPGIQLMSSTAEFKRFGVWDEFENFAMHGTFLLDANNRILWQDVADRPFAGLPFLADEAARLLSAWSRR